MNLNLDFKKLKPAMLLRWLQLAKPYLVGLALISVFGYTAYTVNQAVNVTPATVAATTKPVTFDKTTLDSLKNLTNVPDQVPQTALGKSDPFSNN